MAIAVAAVCLGIGAKFYATLLQTQRLLRTREVVLHRADNLLEAIESVPLDQLGSLKMSDLPEAEPLLIDEHVSGVWLEMSDANTDGFDPTVGPQCRQIVLTVRLSAYGDREIEPIRLVGWRFADERLTIENP